MKRECWNNGHFVSCFFAVVDVCVECLTYLCFCIIFGKCYRNRHFRWTKFDDRAIERVFTGENCCNVQKCSTNIDINNLLRMFSRKQPPLFLFLWEHCFSIVVPFSLSLGKIEIKLMVFSHRNGRKSKNQNTKWLWRKSRTTMFLVEFTHSTEFSGRFHSKTRENEEKEEARRGNLFRFHFLISFSNSFDHFNHIWKWQFLSSFVCTFFRSIWQQENVNGKLKEIPFQRTRKIINILWFHEYFGISSSTSFPFLRCN